MSVLAPGIPEIWTLAAAPASDVPLEEHDLPFDSPQICWDRKAYLAALEAFDVDLWISGRRDDLAEDLEGGRWDNNEIYVESDFAILESANHLALALIPVSEPWEVARFLPHWLENWAWDEETPLVRGRLLRRWQRRWQAEVIATDMYSSIELRPGKKPATRRDATALAWEQVAYCDDMLDEKTIFHVRKGRPDLLSDDLAASLTKNDVWWLWWD